MPNDTREFQTNSLDIAAYLAAHGREPGVFRDKGEQLATFVFRRDDALLALIVKFSTGGGIEKPLLAARRRLFHAVRRLQGGGNEM